MKNLITKILFVLLAILLGACAGSQTATPTLHGDPLAPTAQIATPDLATPTPEIFIPLNPSPTPSGSNLPLTCQVTDLSVYIDQDNGYCYAYPPKFTMGESPYLNVPAVMGPAVDKSPDAVAATFGVVVTPYDTTQKLATQVDNFLKEFTTVDLRSFTRNDLTVGGEPAVMIDNIPVQLSWRVVFVGHAGKLYRLMYWPTDVPAAQQDLEELYQTTLNSFAFLASGTASTSNQTPTQQAEVFEGAQISYGSLSLVIPPGVASGANGSQLPRLDTADAAWFTKTPGNTQLTLNDYLLQDKSLQPQIFIYPTQGYAELNTTAAQSIQGLQAILENPGDAMNKDQLPAVPFFNSLAAFTAMPQVIAFQNGKGVRYITQYAQYAPPANNQDLFYTFQGLTNDGKNYIIAIFPITAPGLSESNDPATSLPVSGIAYPGMGAPSAEWTNYYSAVSDYLNATAPKSFTPTLAQLDTLIESMQISQ